MKKTIIIIAVNVLCLTGVVICQVVSANIKAPLLAGRAAVAWGGQSDERFAQLAAYFPQDFKFDDEAIYNTRKSIDAALVAVSVEDRDNRSLYTDAWSAEGQAQAAGERGSASASIIGVGGDFFLFHPLLLRNGNYITPKDVMQDRVILDEELAWRLYGSVSLAGERVMIGSTPFIIAGVVTRDSGFAFGKTYEGGAGLFMSYQALDAITDGQMRISSYEIVMPDIVTGFAEDILAKALDDESVIIADNTSRFTYGNLFKIIGTYGERSVHTDTISFPYWENAVRYAEDWLALLLLISLLLFICPIVFSVIYIVKLIRFGIRKGVEAVKAWLKRREDRAYERYIQQQG